MSAIQLPPLLHGRRVVVTGASRGIGAAIAQAAVVHGASVALVGRDNPALESVAQPLRSIGAQQVEIVAGDLSRSETPAQIVEDARNALGGIDVLVNNAGITIRRPSVDLTAEEWDRVLAVNLRAAFLTSQAMASEAGDGSCIVNIASLSAFFGVRSAAAYGASKGGLVQLTKALALEWGPRGIRVNAVAPGYVRTDLTKPLTDDSDRYKSVLRRIPLGRWAEPEDIADTAVLLASPLARYVTGQVLTVDGGYTTDG